MKKPDAITCIPQDTFKEQSQILGVSTKAGYKLIRDGQLCCLKVGRTYRIPKVHLLEYLCVGSRSQQQAV